MDEYQSRVVLSKEKASLVIAGAGSGKSLTIIGKVVYLIKCCNVKPEEILCISFTNDATKNLQQNITKYYGFTIDIYTFHRLALKIIHTSREKYEIAPDDLLDVTIDHFFSEVVPQNAHYQKALSLLLKTKETTSLTSIKRLIKTFISLFKGNNYRFSYYLTILKKLNKNFNYNRLTSEKALLLLIVNIHLMYENELSTNKYLDFNDMINKSISLLNKHNLPKEWRYVIIDEYQDTSYVKFKLIDKILQLTDADFLAVGDDFQSIYRFTGCDLQIFLKFTKYFQYSKIFYIVNTYRNPQELINVAGQFVMKNPSQQKKKLRSNKHLIKPIKIYYTQNEINTLKQIISNIPCTKEIMVLGRNNKDIYNYIDAEYKQLPNNYFEYKKRIFRYLTIHKSKGLESDIVIIINLKDHNLGIPTKIKDEKILRFVNNTKDYYPFEEERRLFYVALTRTKTYCYLLVPYEKESIFIREIKKYHQYIEIFKT